MHEEQHLIQHFKLDAFGITPSLGECEDFLRTTDIIQGGGKKEIQDKCRTILKKYKKD